MDGCPVWRTVGRLRLARLIAVVVVLAVTAWAGTACTAATSGPVPADHGTPPVTVLRRGADNGNGDIFIAPTGGGGAAGPEIITSTGKVVWFHALPAGEIATDFRTQTYRGSPVLTWFQGGGPGGGTDYIYNDHYRRIAEVRAGDVVTVKLDLATRVATLVKSVNQPEGLVAPAEGNAQTTRNGDLFVGWGALPYISEFSPSGRLLFNAQLRAGTTYRAYRLPWHPAG